MYLLNIEYFLAIAEVGNITRAAEKLYISQPALSQYLKRLEENLGSELFDRSKSPMPLTYAGQRYLRHILQIQKMDREIRAELRDIGDEISGCLRLGIALWRGACLLPEIFPTFHKQYPRVSVELTEGASNVLERELLADRIDLAVMNLPQGLNYPQLTSDIILEEPIFLDFPTHHPSAVRILSQQKDIRGYPLAPVSLLEEIPLIYTCTGQNLTRQINHFLTRHNLMPEILMQTRNLTTAINLVSRGIACTLVPGEGVEVCTHPGRVTYFRLEDPELSWPLAFVYRKNNYMSRIAKSFICSTKEILGKRSFESRDADNISCQPYAY